MPLVVKVCVLGTTGVGKSKLVQQFVHSHFDEHYQTTASTGEIYHCPTLLNGNLYHFKIVDMPVIKEFPENQMTEWSEFHHCLLRTAHAYILVFDLSNPSSFHYIKVLRDQLFERRHMQNVPVWIAGNKADLCLNVLATMRTHRSGDHHHHLHTHSRPRAHSAQHQACPYDEVLPAFKEFSNLVRKQWKCNYIECSAKFNWRVFPIFREIVKSVDPSPLYEPVTDRRCQASGSSSLGGGREPHHRASVKMAGIGPPESPPLAAVNNRTPTPQLEPLVNNPSHSSHRVCSIS